MKPRVPRRDPRPDLPILLALTPRQARADDASDAAREYRAGRFARAVALYRRAIERGDRRPETLYNLGTAMLAADSLAGAIEVLQRASRSQEAELRFRALFNLGLAHLRQGLKTEGDSAQPALDAALASYKQVLLMRSRDDDAKWNYELALRKKQENQGGGGGGGGGGGNEQSPSPQPSPEQGPAERPSGGLGQQRAEQLLNSAAREEREVQGKRQKLNRGEPPPGGKDW